MTVRGLVSHKLKGVSRKRCLMSFSSAPILPCSRSLLFVLLLSTPAVVNAQWEPDRRLTYNDSSSHCSANNTRSVASGIGGDVHVVWEDRRDGNAEIYYKRSTDFGLNWSQDIRFTNDSHDSWYPSIAISGTLLHVVWTDDREGYSGTYYKRSTDSGINWSSDTRLTADSAGSGSPSIFVSGSDVHLVWDDVRNGNHEVYYKNSTNGGVTWSSDMRLTNGAIGILSPSVSAADSGVHVVWNDLRGGINCSIWYKRSSNGGTSWHSDTILSYNPWPNGSQSPNIYASGSTVHLVWDDYYYSSGNYEIIYKRSNDGGASWPLNRRLTDDPYISRYPTVVVSGSNVHVGWQDNRDGNWEIYYKHSTDGGLSWEPEVRLSNAQNVSEYASISVSGPMTHVIWDDNRDGNYEIYYKRNPTGNSGMEESSGSFYPLTSNLSFSVVPNPFTSFAILPGHEAERFSLYDVSGRKVGVYRGDRIGWGVSPGVYFLRAEKGDRRPVRIVKLR